MPLTVTLLFGEDHPMTQESPQKPVVWIIGATSGIGKALALRLKDKAIVVPSARNPEGLEALAREVACARPVALDATESSQVDAAAESVLSQYGRIDAVVHCVGSILLKSAHRTSDDEWHATIRTNLDSAFYITRAATRILQRQETGGAILLFSTSAAQIGFANHEAIAAAKAGIEGLALASAASYASRKIRINVLAPGLVETPLSRAITTNATALEASRQMHPLGRIGQPDDIARMAESILESPWMSGQVVVVDGGLSGIKR